MGFINQPLTGGAPPFKDGIHYDALALAADASAAEAEDVTTFQTGQRFSSRDHRWDGYHNRDFKVWMKSPGFPHDFMDV